MNGHAQCPVCESLNTQVTEGEFKASGFQAFGNRICNRCGTAWRPSCPRWAAIVCVVTGVLLLLAILVPLGLVLAQHKIPDLGGDNSLKGVGIVGFFVVAGFGFAVYGIAVLCGRAGSMKILGKVIRAPDIPESGAAE